MLGRFVSGVALIVIGVAVIIRRGFVASGGATAQLSLEVSWLGGLVFIVLGVILVFKGKSQ